MERYSSLTEKDIDSKAHCEVAKNFFLNSILLFGAFVGLSLICDIKSERVSMGIFYVIIAAIAVALSAVIASCMIPRYRQEYRSAKHGETITGYIGGNGLVLNSIYSLLSGKGQPIQVQVKPDTLTVEDTTPLVSGERNSLRSLADAL